MFSLGEKVSYQTSNGVTQQCVIWAIRLDHMAQIGNSTMSANMLREHSLSTHVLRSYSIYVGCAVLVTKSHWLLFAQNLEL